MKAGGGKQKGAEFERWTCKRLSLWVTAGEKQDCFWRSAMSGGRATIFKGKGIDLARQAGDISSVSPEGHALTDLFFIETKFYKSLDLDSFLFGVGNLAGFWQTANKEALRHGRKPMVIGKENRREPILLVPPTGLAKISKAKPIARVHGTVACDMFLLEAVLSLPFQVSIAA